jgi:hypothetical protein
MTSCYLTYGDPPPRRRLDRWHILVALAAIFPAGALAGAVWMAVTGDDTPNAAGPAASSTDAMPFTAAIPAVYAPGTNTI